MHLCLFVCMPKQNALSRCVCVCVCVCASVCLCMCVCFFYGVSFPLCHFKSSIQSDLLCVMSSLSAPIQLCSPNHSSMTNCLLGKQKPVSVCVCVCVCVCLVCEHACLCVCLGFSSHSRWPWMKPWLHSNHWHTPQCNWEDHTHTHTHTHTHGECDRAKVTGMGSCIIRARSSSVEASKK